MRQIGHSQVYSMKGNKEIEGWIFSSGGGDYNKKKSFFLIKKNKWPLI